MSVGDPAINNIEPTGYATHDDYFATRFSQGDHPIYSIDLSVPQLVGALPKPDATKPQPGNRLIKEPHARSFGEYVVERSDWVCPPLLLRAPTDEFSFKSIKEVQGSELGVLSVPRNARGSIKILDGQHRILGFHLGWERLNEEIQNTRELLATAKRSGEVSEVVDHHERKLGRLMDKRERLANDRVRIDIMLVDDPAVFKQVFVDIADNARGVTRAVAARFDSRKVVNRALPDVMKHPLLDGRVDEDHDRLSGSNNNLVSAKHVADLIRTAQVGIARRISRKLEAELTDHQVAENASQFLDALDAFPDMHAIKEGQVEPAELRKRSLLGSATMLRVLAGAYYELGVAPHEKRKGKPLMSKTEIARFFSELAPHMGAPVSQSSPWMKTGRFMENGMAPNARQGDLSALCSQLVEWAIDRPAFLSTTS